MPNVLIRGVPPEDLDQIRSAATQRGASLQSYLLQAVQAQAAYLRRQGALVRTGQRLQGGSDVPDDERDAVRQAIDDAHLERAGQLSDPRR